MLANTKDLAHNSEETNRVIRVDQQLQLAVGGYSSAGQKFENQDAFAAYIPQGYELNTKGAVVALADGVSHAEQAAQAAQLSVTQFIQEYYATPDTWSTKHSAAKVLNSLNQWLYSQGGLCESSVFTEPKAQWLTTFSALIVKSTTGYMFHAGDSRISQYRAGQVISLSRDHNLRHAQSKAVLTRALGADSHLEIDVRQIALQTADVYLLSCDGLHDFVSNKQLAQLLAKLPPNPSTTALELCSNNIVAQALANGSNDNITCLLLSVHQIPNLNQDEISELLLSKSIPPALKIGQMIDGYKVLNILHASTRSHLYLVKHAKQAQPVVLKAPSQNFADDALYLQSFIREAWLGARISHPNVMRIANANDSCFLYHIGEYIEGQTLSSWMQEYPKPTLHQVLQIIGQIVSALRMFQRLELVHRDLKPDNIMIDQYRQIKLIDYGTVWIAALDEQLSIEETVPQGSLNYIAPETLLTMTSTHQSDLFSLGVICYEMLTGELPYKPMKRAEVTFKQYQQWQYRSAKQFRPDLPVWIDITLQQATRADPQKRYQAYSELLTDLTKPNVTALAAYQQQPLLQREPVKFWQMVSLLLTIALLVSLFV